ncbi:MAG: hypothetical protein A2268_12265 [Candidatus Raymondbacteria bacterium RifOxyA12_full_50_37]|uniref:Helix-turn-helix domain-containing protein n=1 Tax=Candidatus Raymondbacteria bacterium RIFOXYD12_FULL_49_13 TaxID=1817890 RepID=A0A1F7F2U8_UNCRA|nr:MAG: hypothetical protein A2268_12265 [Candidatus Raymondbacteria bacterium RifOxyA12_full_50_37]OGJ90316.1 MAG: hypothetical protein A2248_00150 [Candidatus Raymondbacteria bacterium RIFOXYA2_FULL_49_16]OGJ97306.1 MAG: hypothetical protein A2453_01610 [Candidatus Raymondbacteria bacterium RIFOXYC2_FULL_50_21]OGK00918.1 MAG: hypothetical protein A2519_12780 [Candidatus Raymondbacteria bacterium RIFOXYD12_FULL_49_13]OGK04559.1 MAG: hypothetical protein A2350_06265 [Candidatus Raymondbacteria 
MFFRKPYLKASEVAKLFDVNHSTVFSWVKKGILRPVKSLGRNFRFRREDIEYLLRSKDSGMSRVETDKRTEPRFAVNYDVFVRLDPDDDSTACPASIRDISSKGLGLVLHDAGRFVEKLASGAIGRISVFNKATGLFKNMVLGNVRHFHVLEDDQVALGVLVA